MWFFCKGFNEARTQTNHTKYVHKCKICGKAVKHHNQNSSQMWILLQTNHIKYVYKCKICGKQFRQSQSFNYHITNIYHKCKYFIANYLMKQEPKLIIPNMFINVTFVAKLLVNHKA